MTAFFVLFVLIGVNAVFVLMEYALIRSRPARIEMLVQQGDAPAARVQEMLGRLDTYLAAVQVGITLVALALGAIAEPPITAALQGVTERLLGDLPDGPLRIISLGVALGLLTFLQIVLGELVPRSLAIQRAEDIARWGSLPLKVWATFCRVPVVLMSASSNAFLRLVGVKPAPEAEAAASEDELRVVLGESQEKGVLPFERLIWHENIFDLGKAKAGEAMTPLDKVAFLSQAKPWAENLETIRSRRHSRYPLCRDGMESVEGFVHVKDLILAGSGETPDLAKVRRDLVAVPESEPVDRMLKVFPDKGIHMALVKAASGAPLGVVTLEDLLEEVVGEIHDEFDLRHAWALTDVVVPSAVAVQLEAKTSEEAVRLLLDRLCAAEPAIPKEAGLKAVLERERTMSSAVGRGVAVPHARLADIRQPFVALGRFTKSVPFANPPDSSPIRLVFLILTPTATPVAQLRILSRIAGLAANESVRRRMLKAKGDAALLDLVKAADTVLAT